MPNKLTTDWTSIDSPALTAESAGSTPCARAELALWSIRELALVLARKAAREDNANERRAAEGADKSGAAGHGPSHHVRRHGD